MLIIGIIKIVLAKRNIQIGVEEVESIFNNVDSTNIIKKNLNTQIEIEGENINTNGTIGLLTFKLEKDYKVGIYEGVTKETLKKGTGRITGSSKLNEKR